MILEDRRKHMRLKSDFSAKCFSINGIEKSKDIKVVNMTREGACLLGKALFKKGDKISLEVTLKNEDESIPISGEIAWVDDQKERVFSGISFTAIDSSHRYKLLHELFEELLKQDS